MALSVPMNLKRLPGMNAIANLLEKSKMEKRAKSSYRPELDRLFRFLGVDQDAEYPEIKEAAEYLKSKYEGDRKMLIKIDNAVDRVFEIMLGNRLKGIGKISEDAELMDLVVDTKDSISKPSNLDKFLRKIRLDNVIGTIVIPTKDWVNKCTPWFMIPLACMIVFPPMGNGLIAIPFLASITHIFNHGREWKTREQRMMEQGQPDDIPPIEYLWPMLYTVFWIYIGSFIGNALLKIAVSAGMMPAGDQSIPRMMTVITLYIGTLVSKPYRGNGGSSAEAVEKGW
eukprot:CAMPEP_0117751860 /NCGR_PEP_ID=MMETSP0947-20121206/11240_1 /TAXON_ID=44440 /ORGANISM="Chattonella subsalsa, Strain CCMP2191" /LENGTH=283 /DNA_ID=CAMNT_0005570349 /DNA_START=206 /DNA_END=1057 /DNA_ORIENTATION=-